VFMDELKSLSRSLRRFAVIATVNSTCRRGSNFRQGFAAVRAEAFDIFPSPGQWVLPTLDSHNLIMDWKVLMSVPPRIAVAAGVTRSERVARVFAVTGLSPLLEGKCRLVTCGISTGLGIAHTPR
jgi:hypothetical protein